MTVRRGGLTTRTSDTCLNTDIAGHSTTANIIISSGSRSSRNNNRRSRTSKAQNVRSAAMARPSTCAAVEEVPSCTIARCMLGRVAPSGGRMIFGCLLVWGYCLTSCLGLLLSPEPYPTGMNNPRGHGGGIFRANSYHHGHQQARSGNHAQMASDTKPYTKPRTDTGAFMQNSKVFLPINLLPYSKESEVIRHARHIEHVSKNTRAPKVQTVSKKDRMVHLADKDQSDSSATQHSAPGNHLRFALQPPLPFHVQSYKKSSKQSDDNSSKRRSPSRGERVQSLDFHLRDLNNHTNEPNVYRSIVTKRAKVTDISRNTTGIGRKRNNTRHSTSPIHRPRFESASNKIHDKLSLQIKGSPKKSTEHKGDLNSNVEDKSSSEDNLPFLIQKTAQKMQSRLDYLMSLKNDEDDADDEDNDDDDDDGDGRDDKYTDKDAKEPEDKMIPAYLNSYKDLINHTQIPTNLLATKQIETIHLARHRSLGETHDVASSSSKDYPDIDTSQDQRNTQHTDVFERDVMSAVVRALAHGKVPEDVYFWRNVSRLLDSDSYLSRTRRSPYRSRYLRRRRPYSRNSSRYRFAIIYNHVRPCLRRDRYYCMNGGTCVFVVALDIKTCRCPIGYTGVRCEYIDQEYILSLLSNSLVDTR